MLSQNTVLSHQTILSQFLQKNLTRLWYYNAGLLGLKKNQVSWRPLYREIFNQRETWNRESIDDGRYKTHLSVLDMIFQQKINQSLLKNWYDLWDDCIWKLTLSHAVPHILWKPFHQLKSESGKSLENFFEKWMDTVCERTMEAHALSFSVLLLVAPTASAGPWNIACHPTLD